MAMEKVAGTELKTGIASITGMVAQSGSKSAGGDLVTYENEQGETLSLYLKDDHKEVSFEGLLRTTDTTIDKKIGDEFTALGVTGYLTAWQVQWTNNDVAKVSGSLRDYTFPSSGTGGSGGQN